MSIKNVFKKSALFMAFICMLLTISGVKAVKAETVPVQLNNAQVNQIRDNYGAIQGYYVSGYVSVANLAYAKQVVIHYSYDKVTWQDVAAKYVRTAPDGTEAWYFETAKTYPSQHYYNQPCTFAVKYVVNGTTYWDNNGGKNYYTCASMLESVSPNVPYVLSKSNVALGSSYKGQSTTNTSYDRLTGTIALKNLAYTKVVKVRYSTDNWVSYKEANASYSQAFSNGVEEWSFSIDNLPKFTTVKFAISYTVNGVTYWDNNFGANYSK